MNSMAIVLISAFALFFWSRHMAHQRRRWLRRLGLPGRWQMWPAMAEDAKPGPASAAAEAVATLELAGDISAGTFRWLDAADGQLLDTGHWILKGHRLVLTSSGGSAGVRQFDVRLLQPAEVGLFEPATACYWLLSRGNTNVVSLPRREAKH